MRNLDHFFARHKSLDAYLMPLVETDRLLKSTEVDPVLRREIETFYSTS